MIPGEFDEDVGLEEALLADPGNHRVLRYQPTKFRLSRFAGNGSAGRPVLGGQPHAMALLTPVALAKYDDDVAIADCDNDAVFAVKDGLTKAEFELAVSLIAGTRGFSGDDGAAAAAQLNCPLDLEFDAAGNLYILDAGTNRVRKVVNPFAPGAVIATIAGNGGNGF